MGSGPVRARWAGVSIDYRMIFSEAPTTATPPSGKSRVTRVAKEQHVKEQRFRKDPHVLFTMY